MTITAYTEWGVEVAPDHVEFFRIVRNLPEGNILEKKSIVVYANGEVWRSTSRLNTVKPTKRATLNADYTSRVFQIAKALQNPSILPAKALSAVDAFITRGVHNQYIDIFYKSLINVKEVNHGKVKKGN